MYIIQNNFNGGEISGTCDSRQDTQQYAKSLKTMTNFIPTPQGAAVNRPGLKYIASTKDSSTIARGIPFVFSESIAYMLEFGDYYVRFYRNGGQLSVSSADDWVTATAYAVGDYVTYSSLIYRCITAHTASSDILPTNTTYWTQSAIYEIVSPYSADDLSSLQFTQSADVMYFTNGSYKPKTLTRSGDTSWAFADFANTNGPFAPMNTDTTLYVSPSGDLYKDGTITLTSTADLFYSGHVGTYFKLEQDVEAQCVSSTFTSDSGYSDVQTSSLSLSGFYYNDAEDYGYEAFTATFTLTITGTISGSTITLYYSVGGSATYTALLTETATGTYTATVSVTAAQRKITAYAKVTDTTGGTFNVTLAGTGNGTTKTVSTSNAAAGYSDSCAGMGTWMVTTHGTWTGVLWLEKSTDGGTTWKKLRQYSCATDNIADSGSEDDEQCELRLRMYDYTSGTCRYDLQWEPYTNYGICKITAVSSTTVATATVTQAIGSTDSTTYWYLGAWSSIRGWPSGIIFFQNRLCFGGTTAEPQTVWTSKSGDYTNFNTSFTTEDDDAVTAPLVSDKVNAIKSLKALSSKIIGMTEGAYWLVGAGDSSSILTPTSVAASAEGYYGATDLVPVMVGNRILFVGSKGHIVRDMGFDINSESYVAQDLTLFAEHLFRARTVSGWAYAQYPYSIVWCIGSDGDLLGLTYNREQNICGWHRHVTDGKFESVCVIPTTTTDQVWCIVKRTINGSTVRTVEVMQPRVTTATETTNDAGETVVTYDPADQFFVDCGLTATETTAKATWEGLDYLEGKTVSILADGNVVSTATVTDGAITLDHTASTVTVGLPYTCDLETLDIDFQSQDGTVQTRKKQITKVNLRVENSRAFYLGPTFTDMKEIKMTPKKYDTAIPLYTDDLDCNFRSGATNTGRVCIRVTDPVPVTIQSITSEVSLNG